MIGDKYLILFYGFFYLSAAAGELSLDEGSPCTSNGVKGTCVSLYRCGSAAVSEAYRNAGYSDKQVPKLPEICSTKDKVPIVCCTDCKISERDAFKNYVVAPSGAFIEKKGPKARDKCLDYFQRLPYPCRGAANVKIEKKLDEKKNCHEYTIDVAPPPEVKEADKNNFTHTVLLGYGEDVASAEWLCGGFVISERFIVTAEHCLDEPGHGKLSFARLRVNKRSDPKESWEVYKIKSIIKSPELVPKQKYHDIALLETENEITFDEKLLPICLDVGGVDKKTAYLSGWGVPTSDSPYSDSIKEVHHDAVAKAECDAEYPPDEYIPQGFNHTTMMCYRAQPGAVGSCDGDGGSPLQVADSNCQFIAVGVTSFGKICGSKPDVYGRLEYYVPWIESIVWP